ncbi:MAG: matrixin family metalloprotease [Candidatus Kerfeldbacteria bacterium]|nr:matrixin family metalloprotease [Candidatus Kerfeldbacteria bacterium]
MAFPWQPVQAYKYAGYRWGGSFPKVGANTSGLLINAWRTSASDAIGSWNNAGAQFNFYSQDGSANKMGYYYEQSDVLAYAKTYRRYVFSGDIVKAEIYVNNFHNFNPPYTSGAWHDLRTVRRHEYGHWLRLDHSQVQAAVMYYAIPHNTVKNLAADDINGTRYIYGAR